MVFPLRLLLLSCLLFTKTILANDEYYSLQPLLVDMNTQYPILQQVLQNPTKYRLQIIYTQVNRDKNNQPSFTRYQLGLDEQQYFYPASIVKLPIALLALEWLEQHKDKGIKATTTMLTDSAAPEQTSQLTDTSSKSGLPSISHYIKKILLVSDNDASNRLFELLGQDYINEALKAKGLNNTIINHRLSVPFTAEQNRHYNPVRFVDHNSKQLYSGTAAETTIPYRNINKPRIGKAYIADKKIVYTPMDFSDKNRLSLNDFDGIIKRIVFPNLFIPSQRFNLTISQRKFMLNYMSMVPSASADPVYDVTEYPDNYSKFLMFGGTASELPSYIKIFNKTGWSYGHVIDGAYIVDINNNIEFFLSAVIYVNENDILNDDKYQVADIALPFLNQLGNYLYKIELKRPRKHQADLTDILMINTKTRF